MSEKHTPGKLERNSIRGWELWVGADYHIADVHGNIDSRRANALHIVKCWNSHDALLEACKFAKAQIRRGSHKKALPILRAAIAQAEKV